MRTWLLRVKFWIPKYLHMNLQVVELTAPSASLQMTPSWVVQMIQQKNRWHPEEPLGLERWVYTNLRKFKKAKCKVMQPGWGNSKCQYRLGGWVDWEPQSRDGLGGVGWWKKKIKHQPATQACSPENKSYPGLHEKEVWPAGWGTQFSRSAQPLQDSTYSPAFSCGAMSIRKIWSI